MEEQSKRKPYNRPVTKDWWLKKSFYTKYMLREGTSIFALIFAIEMLFMYMGTAINCEWMALLFASWPFIIINAAALAAVIYHAVTWFALMPKAQRLFLGDKLVDGKWFVIALYATLSVVTAVGAVLYLTPLLRWLLIGR